MIHIVDFMALILATDVIVSAWFYGSLFESYREKLEKRNDLIGELAGCPFCLSYHVGMAFALFVWLPMCVLDLLPFPISLLALLPRCLLYGLAAADVTHWLQGERPIPVSEEDDASTDGKETDSENAGDVA